MTTTTEPTGNQRRLTRRDWIAIAICWLALAVWYLVFAGAHDVDDTLRLVQVRALMAGQGWFDLTQYRIAPPEGVPMHWSRLVDLPIVAAIAVAQLLVAPERAEQFALAAVPLATMACAATLIYRAALRLSGERGDAVLAVLLACTTGALMGQLDPGRIDHHGWQIVAALAALNGLLSDRPRASGAAIGAGLALWLAISIEGLPMTAAFLAVLGLRWLCDREQRTGLVAAAATLAAFSTVLWLATHRLDAAALAGWCDVVTPVHLAMFVWTAVGVAGVATLPAGSRLRDAALLAGVALVGLAIFALASPQCLTGGGFNRLDPLVTRYWLANVGESMPVWTRPLVPAITMFLPPAVGLAALAAFARRQSPQIPQRVWGYLAVLAAASLMGCWMVRAFGVATAFAAPPLAWGLRRWFAASSTEPRGAVRLVRWLAMVCVLTPWLVGLMLLLAIRVQASGPSRECNLESHAGRLAALPPATFLAPFDLGPQLLLTTPHRILASGHHRAAAAMRDELAALLGSPDTARAIIARRHVGYVAICFDAGDVGLYEKASPNGFLARLARGEVPAWLTPVPIGGSNAPKVWRVTGP